MDAIQLDFFADDPNNRPMLLSALGEGIQNAFGVYTENVLEFREGLLPHNYVCVRLCAEGDEYWCECKLDKIERDRRCFCCEKWEEK